jgi:hypothetical protein
MPAVAAAVATTAVTATEVTAAALAYVARSGSAT